MKCYTYVVVRDFGFAPNPFHGYCTLATCKPKTRSVAKIGDWVVGTGSKPSNLEGKVICAMKITEALSFNEYWNDERFQAKKPIMNGSLIQAYGDNIYFYDAEVGKWHQEDSHHSNEDGSINETNLKRDTGTDRVLISNHFYYFGQACDKLPDNLVEKICKRTNHKIIDDSEDIRELLQWLEKVGELNTLKGFPNDLDLNEFSRFKG